MAGGIASGEVTKYNIKWMFEPERRSTAKQNPNQTRNQRQAAPAKQTESEREWLRNRRSESECEQQENCETESNEAARQELESRRQICSNDLLLHWYFVVRSYALMSSVCVYIFYCRCPWLNRMLRIKFVMAFCPHLCCTLLILSRLHLLFSPPEKKEKKHSGEGCYYLLYEFQIWNHNN